jgi:hypothetical protein
MKHATQHRKSSGPRFTRISFGILCAIALALTPAAFAQRGGGGRLGGAAGHFTRGGMGSGRPRVGAYPHIPVSWFQTPIPIVEGKSVGSRIGGPRFQVQFERRFYRGYGFWPLYGWFPSWAPDCAPYPGRDCYGNDYSDAEAEESDVPATGGIQLNSVLVVYLRDGSGYGVNDYWVADGALHFVTTYDSEKSVAFEDIDWQRTVDENATRGVYFKLSYSPSKQRREPAIAPTCPASSSDNAGTGASRPLASGKAGSFGAAVAATDQGLRVTLVRAGSPAAQVGIHPGDVLLRIDCQPLHSSGDIESAIAANASGAPWVTYLIKGAWLSEQQIKLR